MRIIIRKKTTWISECPTIEEALSHASHRIRIQLLLFGPKQLGSMQKTVQLLENGQPIDFQSLSCLGPKQPRIRFLAPVRIMVE